MSMNARTGDQAGFTILELMMASLVFSTILIVITVGVIRVSEMYYKGNTITQTQNVARNILDSVAQSIQFDGTTVSWPQPSDNGNATVQKGRGCIGTQEYDFQLGYKLENGGTNDGTPDLQAADALTFSPSATGCTEAPQAAQAGPPSIPGVGASFTPLAGATELLSPQMRLTRFSVAPLPNTANMYKVAVTVVYGDYDLLCRPSIAAGNQGSCAQDSPIGTPNANFLAQSDLTCRPGEGSEYCAVSALTTVVQQRLTLNE